MGGYDSIIVPNLRSLEGIIINVKKHPIMTSISTYAQERISFYEARFKTETNHQLAIDFTSLSASRGWTAERSYYSRALVCVMKCRGINLDAVISNKGGATVIHYIPVGYDDTTHAMIPAI